MINQILNLHNNWDDQVAVDFTSNNWIYPIGAVLVYIAMISVGPKFMANREPLPLKSAFKVWNFLLASFSIVGSFYCIPDAIRFLQTRGLQWTVCTHPSDSFYYKSDAAFWFFAFGVSKIPELVDTFFLVAQKKPVIFLHWYHHITVLLYCWHAYSVGVGAGIYFTAMNYMVHSVMYSYYFMMCFPSLRKVVRKIAMFITSLQLLQMVVGVTITCLTAYYFYESKHEGTACHVDVFNLEMAFAMYTSYFVLFGALFRKLYGPKPPKVSKSD